MKRILTTLIFASTALAQAPASTDALDALRGLKSATEVGINLRDYAPRVVDAKVKLDKYLATAPKDGQQLEPIMQAYVLALRVWRDSLSRGPSYREMGEAVLGNPEIAACSETRSIVALATRHVENWKNPSPKIWPNLKPNTIPEEVGVLVTPQALWKCAAEKLASLKP